MFSSIERWDYFEAQATENPFLDVSTEAEFTYQQRVIRVSEFYDGYHAYHLRFMPDMEGTWHC